MTEKSAVRTWIAVLIAAIVVVCVGVIALVGGSAYFVARHVSTDFVPADHADERFAAARQRLAGHAALIELRDGDAGVIRRAPAGAKLAPITSVRALIYDPNDGRIVDVSLPVWLLRLAPGGELSFIEHGHFDTGRIHFTFEDVERHGPGLILDGTDRDGTRILIWSQ
jgi:hypothetical protein